MPDTLTKAQWRRRALKAEAQVELMGRIRSIEHVREWDNLAELSRVRVALKEIQDAIDFAKGEK